MSAGIVGSSPVARRWLPVAVLVAACAIAVSASNLLAASGFRSGFTNDLAGRALLGIDGKIGVGEIISAYPPLAYLPMLAAQGITDLAGGSAARLLAALLAGAMVATWLHGLLRANYQPLAALLLTVLLALNPIFLRAMLAGPEAMLALWGVWLFAISVFTLRASGAVDDLILVSVSLVILFFTAPLGAVFAIAALPFLLLSTPTDVARNSQFSVYLVLLFPLLFCLFSFMFVSWLFLHDPWAFVPRRVLESPVRAAQPWWTLTIGAVLSAVAAAPILIGLIVRARARRLVQAPAFALLGILMLAIAIALLGGVTESFAIALIPAAAIAAALALRWPQEDGRFRRVALLIALGMIGAGVVVRMDASPTNVHFRQALTGQTQPPSRRAAEADLGEFLAGRSDVLIDAAAFPAVVAARGSAEGLITSTDTAFALSVLRRRVETREVAVPAPDPSRNADIISRALPDLYGSGAPGLRLIYDQGGWRVWRRDLPAEGGR